MQNMRTRLFMKKHGPALVFSLCLVGAAAAYHRQYPGIRPDRKNTRQSGCFIDRCDARENMGILT